MHVWRRNSCWRPTRLAVRASLKHTLVHCSVCLPMARLASFLDAEGGWLESLLPACTSVSRLRWKVNFHSIANHRPTMRSPSSWWRTSESSRPSMLTRLAGRPRVIVQIFLIICVGYFLVVSSSNRHPTEVSSTANESTEVENQVSFESQVKLQIITYSKLHLD